jgi:hypothetical protein
MSDDDERLDDDYLFIQMYDDIDIMMMMMMMKRHIPYINDCYFTTLPLFTTPAEAVKATSYRHHCNPPPTLSLVKHNAITPVPVSPPSNVATTPPSRPPPPPSSSLHHRFTNIETPSSG